MRIAPLSALVALCSLSVVAACRTWHTSRNGPPFAEAFPDPTVLVTTPSPESVRETLANVQLPEEQAHHDRLLQMLHEQPAIDAPHLLLLVEAVALPQDHITFCSRNHRSRTYTPRGAGRFAPVADQLLEAGLPKLAGVTREQLGELLARTHSDATLAKVADALLPQLDDGSDRALREVIDGMFGAPAVRPFLCDHLVPRGLLQPNRGWQLLDAFSFDEDRVALVEALAKQTPTTSQEQLERAVAAMSFDEGRERAVRALAGPCCPIDPGVARAVVAKFSFDDGRAAACAALAAPGGVSLDGDQLLAIVRLHSFDEGRSRAVRALAPNLRGPLDGDGLRRLLDAFSFDDGRLDAVRTLRGQLGPLGAGERKHVLAAFSFDDDRARAGKLLPE